MPFACTLVDFCIGLLNLWSDCGLECLVYLGRLEMNSLGGDIRRQMYGKAREETAPS